MASLHSRTIAPNVDVNDPQLTDLDLGWCAGIYEGEGNAWGNKGRTVVVISQKDPELLFRLRAMWGGRIEMHRADTPKYIHVWKLYGDRARRFFQAVYPYLTARRQGQIVKVNGLKFTGFKQDLREPMDVTRAARRATMSKREKELESYLHYRHKNLERVRAQQREYQMRKRSGALASEMIQ